MSGARLVYADEQAFELFRSFVRENAAALRMVANWGDGECGALHDVLRKELQGWEPVIVWGSQKPPGSAPLFAEDGGVDL